TPLMEPLRKPAEPRPPAARAIVVRKAKKDHPWRQGYAKRNPPVGNLAAPPVGIRTSASP
ncbi:MAG TPA: hypothetical protein VEK33_10680, partial [Terriglobales bacterium]|nr:hypothetical protein [Terriglobales bacterium]